MIKKHFPQGHKFHKIFNKNNVKVSYSCMANMKSIISSHNKTILTPNEQLRDGYRKKLKSRWCTFSKNPPSPNTPSRFYRYYAFPRTKHVSKQIFILLVIWYELFCCSPSLFRFLERVRKTPKRHYDGRRKYISPCLRENLWLCSDPWHLSLPSPVMFFNSLSLEKEV